MTKLLPLTRAELDILLTGNCYVFTGNCRQCGKLFGGPVPAHRGYLVIVCEQCGYERREKIAKWIGQDATLAVGRVSAAP